MILAKCDHKNIIRLFCAFEDDNQIYLVMELAWNGNLFHFLRKNDISEDLCWKFMLDII